MIKNSFLISMIFYFFLLCSFSQLYGKEIKKIYPKKECIELKAVLGNCKLIKSQDDMLHVAVYYSFNDEEFHADISDRDDTISLVTIKAAIVNPVESLRYE